MAESVQMSSGGGSAGLVAAAYVAAKSVLEQAANGIRYAAQGENNLDRAELVRMVQTVPGAVAGALKEKAYYFVPLALNDRSADEVDADEAGTGAVEESAAAGAEETGEETMVALAYSVEMSDRAICHRNVRVGNVDGVFISTRLLGDRFALAFEFFINVGHAFVDAVGVPEAFAELAWKQVLADVRGETSQDAWDGRTQSVKAMKLGTSAHIDEKAKSRFLEAAFSDAVAIYQLSLAVDFDYSELREREYPLLAPQALAERLRLVAALFPPNSGYEFSIRYRRRG